MGWFRKLWRKIRGVKSLSLEDRARELGVKVGKGTRFAAGWPHFGSEPFLVEIGEDCLVSNDVQFLTHDGSTMVVSSDSNVSKYGRVKIGNRCFIGCRSLIMPGVTIGDGSVIGAASLVTKNVPSGEVWAGHPARFMMTIEDYRQKVLQKSSLPLQADLRKEVLRHRENGS